METTSLSVRNDALLKSARRWIIAAFVLMLLSNIPHWFGVFNYDSFWYRFLYAVLIHIIYLFFFVMGFQKIRQHSNVCIKAIAMPLLIYAALTLINIIKFFCFQYYIQQAQQNNEALISIHGILCWVLVAVINYCLITAYSQLLKVEEIKYNHPEIYVLCLFPFISLAFFIKNVLPVVRTTYFVDGYFTVWYTIDAIVLNMVSELLILVGYIICWKRLFRTPTDIPDMAPEGTKVSFIPSKVEIGFIVSILLYIGILYVASIFFTNN